MPKDTNFKSSSSELGASADWRCTCCGKLLGQRHGSVVLVQFARGHQYRSPRPVSAVCRSCDTLNET